MTDTFLHGVTIAEISDGARTISTPATSVIGLVGTAPYASAAFPLDTPVLVTTAAQIAALKATLPDHSAAGAEGSLPLALTDIFDQARTPVVVVRVLSNAVTNDASLTTQLGHVVGAIDEQTGVYALLGAKSLLGVKPKILIAPGWTHQEVASADNPVVAALKTVAGRLRAVVVSDGPNDTDDAAIATAAAVGDQRLYITDPFVKVFNAAGAVVSRPLSGRAAGVIARTDQDKGYWWSPSNQVINGVVGLARPIEFGIADPSTASNRLNAAGVATVISNGGYRLWGNRTSGADSQWAFLSVRRTVDIIEDAVEAAYLWALDRPFSAQLLKDVVNELEAFLRSLKGQGAILDGKVWLDPELNTAAAFLAGQAFIDFDIEPPAPLEHLTFRVHRNGDYYAELVDAVSRQAAA